MSEVAVVRRASIDQAVNSGTNFGGVHVWHTATSATTVSPSIALDPARVIKPQPVPEDLVCAICTGVLQDPVEGPCEHIFCRKCLVGWLQRSNNNSCPTCRQPLMPSTIRQAHRVVRNQLDAVEVTCENAARGCQAVIALGALESHLSSCGKAIACCLHDGCMSVVLREDMQQHLQACPHRMTSCPHCKASVRHQDEEKHLQHTCPGVEVPCQHNGGCGKSLRRDGMAAHIKTECGRAMVACTVPGCQKQVARGAMKQHLEESLAEHVTSLSAAFQQANAKIATQQAELTKLQTSMVCSSSTACFR
eukprot:jgi/Mesvir1/15537/Mv03187-RA.1